MIDDFRTNSRQAWVDHVPITAVTDRAILEALSSAGPRGITCAEIEARTSRSHQAISGNLRHLAERGLVERSGFRGSTPSGRPADCWRVNLMGPERAIAPSGRRNKLREAVEQAISDLGTMSYSPKAGHVAGNLRRALEGKS